MDNWRQERLATVTTALRGIERRTDTLVRRINNGSIVGHRQHSKPLATWADEVARLQDMSDRLLEFKGCLYFYSNRAYVEALNQWENEVEK